MTTIQYILANLRAQMILPPEQVNYGRTDGLQPPYATVDSYKHNWDRTTGLGIREGSFTLLITAKDVDEAETIAARFDSYLDKNTSLTPQDMTCYQETWETGRMEPSNLYQYGTLITYTLFETAGA